MSMEICAYGDGSRQRNIWNPTCVGNAVVFSTLNCVEKMHVGHNVCVSPKLACQSSNLCDGVWRWGLWEIIRAGGHGSHDGVKTFIGGENRAFSLSAHKDVLGPGCLQGQRRTSPGANPRTSKSWGKSIPGILKPLSLWYFVKPVWANRVKNRNENRRKCEKHIFVVSYLG